MQETEQQEEDITRHKKLTEEERNEIVNAVYDRFYNQVGHTAIRAILYVTWAATIYAAYVLASSGWLKPGG